MHYLRFTLDERSAQARTGIPATRMLRAVERKPDRLKGKTLVLDAGHGVNYEDEAHRLYEWFVASRICDQLADAWTQLGGTVIRCPSARFLFQEASGPGQRSKPALRVGTPWLQRHPRR